MQQIVFSRFAAAVLFFAAALNLSAQGTAISYQGRLFVSGAPANTNYDLRFAVYDAVTNGNRISPYLTNAAVPVSDGLFSVTLNFGQGVFNGTGNGSNDFLDIAVRATNVTAFTALTPRQPILPVPYAIFATSASNLLGVLPSALFTGSYSNALTFSNPTNVFVGTFSGNGINLTNLNASNVSTGTLADVRLSANVPLLNGNQTFTGGNTFNGSSTFAGSAGFNGGATFSSPSVFSAGITSSAANFFSGVNTFTNNANSFQGNFFGNGLVGWAPVGGTSTNALRDHGYLVANASLTSVTLPTTSSFGGLFVGDIVRVSGGGGGGFLVKVSSGQSIIGNFASYANCQANTVYLGDFSDVAASADGARMYAVGNSANGIAGVQVSTDGGRSWNATPGEQSSSWSSVACSANGMIVYAQKVSGDIWKSTDGGLSWTDTGTASGITAIGCTANGATLFTGNIACSGNGTYLARISGGGIQISSTGSSGTWLPATPIKPAGATVTCLAASSDCTRLLAGATPGRLYASSDQGATWSTLTSSNQYWSGAWMSPDGSKFAATVSLNGSVSGSIVSSIVSALPNTASTTGTGTICGSQGSAVELQLINSTQFMPVSSTGLLWAN